MSRTFEVTSHGDGCRKFLVQGVQNASEAIHAADVPGLGTVWYEPPAKPLLARLVEANRVWDTDQFIVTVSYEPA